MRHALLVGRGEEPCDLEGDERRLPRGHGLAAAGGDEVAERRAREPLGDDHELLGDEVGVDVEDGDGATVGHVRGAGGGQAEVVGHGVVGGHEPDRDGAAQSVVDAAPERGASVVGHPVDQAVATEDDEVGCEGGRARARPPAPASSACPGHDPEPKPSGPGKGPSGWLRGSCRCGIGA